MKRIEALFACSEIVFSGPQGDRDHAHAALAGTEARASQDPGDDKRGQHEGQNLKHASKESRKEATSNKGIATSNVLATSNALVTGS